jgi:hypothetical protein
LENQTFSWKKRVGHIITSMYILLSTLDISITKYLKEASKTFPTYFYPPIFDDFHPNHQIQVYPTMMENAYLCNLGF